jgi:hypothetical protein
LYALAIKSKLAMTDTDYRTDTREQHTGDYANFAWNLPFIMATNKTKASKFLS